MNAAEPIDCAAVKAEHPGNEIENCGPDLFCLECDVEWPCLVYLLAVDAERLAGKVARVKALLANWRERHAFLVSEHGKDPWWRGFALRMAEAATELEEVLDDQPEQATGEAGNRQKMQP